MTIRSYLIDTILKVYNRHQERETLRRSERERLPVIEDTVSISEEGKKRIFEKLRQEAIERLKSQR